MVIRQKIRNSPKYNSHRRSSAQLATREDNSADVRSATSFCDTMEASNRTIASEIASSHSSKKVEVSCADEFNRLQFSEMLDIRLILMYIHCVIALNFVCKCPTFSLNYAAVNRA
ncbi:hypothetical protein TELCIR_13480 [Teladorsagia circumcincta]|uniref:Uncharacterized protein n=1 Tax=Teladorsagia circumcincta TaxID=45464 RepID=A0A2G9U3Q5_TELCI|nr:hypothetical protein TELCIR_13480 [Teladorsagia circumcincta]